MKLDQVVLKRFEELAEKAEKVDESKRYQTARTEVVSSELFYEWSTSVLSLLERVFGKAGQNERRFMQSRSI